MDDRRTKQAECKCVLKGIRKELSTEHQTQIDGFNTKLISKVKNKNINYLNIKKILINRFKIKSMIII